MDGRSSEKREERSFPPPSRVTVTFGALRRLKKLRSVRVNLVGREVQVHYHGGWFILDSWIETHNPAVDDQQAVSMALDPEWATPWPGIDSTHKKGTHTCR